MLFKPACWYIAQGNHGANPTHENGPELYRNGDCAVSRLLHRRRNTSLQRRSLALHQQSLEKGDCGNTLRAATFTKHSESLKQAYQRTRQDRECMSRSRMERHKGAGLVGSRPNDSALKTLISPSFSPPRGVCLDGCEKFHGCRI